MSNYDPGYGEEKNGTIYLEVTNQRTWDWGPGGSRPAVKTEHPPEEWEAYIALPHQCDDWKIGNVGQARQMITDLEEVILELEAGSWRSNEKV